MSLLKDILTDPQKLAHEIASDAMADEDEIAGAIAMAISFERERVIEMCAKVAEDDTSFMMLQDFGMQSTCTQVRTNIAEAIRSLKSQPAQSGEPQT